MYYVGIDVHGRLFAMCILDHHGKTVKQTTIRGTLDDLMKAVAKLPAPFAVCYEASCGYGYLHDRLAGRAQRVVVAHPGQLRLIFRSKRKNDRIDAKKLATLLFLDQVPPVHVPSLDVRSWRQLIGFRQRAIAKRVRVKNSLRALLRTHGITPTPGKSLWTRQGRAELTAAELPTTRATLQRDLLLDELTHLDAQVRRVEQELNRAGQAHWGVRLLRTIPGVGPRTAEAVVAFIDDPARFRSNKQIGSYFGLIPCQDQSGDTNRLGHITREGPALVRKLLTEAAWQGIRRSPTIRAYFERVERGERERRKIALIATAHYLVRVMLALLRTGEPWAERQAWRQVA